MTNGVSNNSTKMHFVSAIDDDDDLIVGDDDDSLD